MNILELKQVFNQWLISTTYMFSFRNMNFESCVNANPVTHAHKKTVRYHKMYLNKKLYGLFILT